MEKKTEKPKHKSKLEKLTSKKSVCRVVFIAFVVFPITILINVYVYRKNNWTKCNNCFQNRNSSLFENNNRCKTETLGVEKYVSFHDSINDGRRLGNQMFIFAAVLYVAELAGRTPAIANSSKILLEKVFQLNLIRIDKLCPCRTIIEKHHVGFDPDIERDVFAESKLFNHSILVHGFRQSWKYTRGIECRLRRHLMFCNEIEAVADDFLSQNIPHGWKKEGFVRVGIHVRRGDILAQRYINYGYAVPSESYFQKAMKYFTDKYSRVQFILASDDSKWTTKHFANASSDTVNITYSLKHTTGEDMAILSKCDHVIMSTGTYGWWAAWLANGTTIYYSDWPRKGSTFDRKFSTEDFFPSNWIPMSS